MATIPSDAVALQLNVTALGASALTFLTFWPSDETRPLAANLNPAPGQFPTPNAVTVALSAAGQFNVYNDVGAVNVVIDVGGYYTDQSLKELASPEILYAIVNSTGDLVRHEGGSDPGTNRIGGGTYEVEFDRDITACVAIGNPADQSEFGIPSTQVTVVKRGGNAQAVFVQTRSSAGALTDSAFTIVILCA